MVEKTSHVLFRIVGIIMRVAPLGAFGAMAFTIGKYGVVSLLSLAIPLCLLYEVGIWSARLFIRATKAPDEETAAAKES